MNLQPKTLEAIEKVIPRYPVKRSAVLPLLHLVQEDQSFISDAAIEWIAGKLDLAPINVLEVVSFYPGFRQTKPGRHIIRLCRTLSCALMGGYAMAEMLKSELGCDIGENSSDGSVRLEFVECLACCGSAPVMMIDDELFENLTEEKVRILAGQVKDGSLFEKKIETRKEEDTP